jgi:chaperonin cofactor prefoldin
MTDDELRELVHRVELRIERLDARFDALEKTVGDVRAEIRTRLEGVESRINTKASNWVVSLWGATLAVLIALLTLWR